MLSCQVVLCCLGLTDHDFHSKKIPFSDISDGFSLVKSPDIETPGSQIFLGFFSGRRAAHLSRSPPLPEILLLSSHIFLLILAQFSPLIQSRLQVKSPKLNLKQNKFTRPHRKALPSPSSAIPGGKSPSNAAQRGFLGARADPGTPAPHLAARSQNNRDFSAPVPASHPSGRGSAASSPHQSFPTASRIPALFPVIPNNLGLLPEPLRSARAVKSRCERCSHPGILWDRVFLLPELLRGTRGVTLPTPALLRHPPAPP